jgi:hypothetical protein
MMRPSSSSGLLHVGELFPPVSHSVFMNAVHAFRYGIVRRLVVLCHADGYMVLIQTFHIGIAAVLYASVGVMDKTVQIVFPVPAIAISSACSV